MDLNLSRVFKDAIYNGNELYRNGYTRFNLSYFYTQEDVDYILNAVEFIGNFGWMFLPDYEFNIQKALWVNKRDKITPKIQASLTDIDYSRGKM